MSYNIIFILILIGGLYFLNNKDVNGNNRKLILLFSWIILTIYWGGVDASHIGGDVEAYYGHALSAGNNTLDDYMYENRFERGFIFYIWYIMQLTTDPQIFLFITAGLVNAMVLCFISRTSNNLFLGIVSYVCIGGYLFFFTAMRQGIATGICLIAFLQIIKNRWYIAIPLVLFATLFHITSIVILPLLFLKYIKINGINTSLVILGGIILALSVTPIVEFGNEFMSEEYGSEYEYKSYVGPIINICWLIISLLLNYKNQQYHIVSNTRNLFYYLTLFTVIIYILRFEVLALERIAFYLLPIASISLANGIQDSKYHIKSNLPNHLFTVACLWLFFARQNIGYQPFWI